MRERLTFMNMGNYQKGQITPCNDCEMDPQACGKQYRVSVPGKESDVMCKKFGVIEVVDLSVNDKFVKISVVRKNGKPITNQEIPAAAAEAAL